MACIVPSFGVMALAMTIFSSSLIFAASKEEDVGQVFFVGSKHHKHLRASSLKSNTEETFSQQDVAASVAALLGVSPPSSSDKIDSEPSSNPSERPVSVLVLTIRGLNLELLNVEDIKEFIGLSITQQRLLSENGQQGPFVPSGQDVALEPLNKKWVDQEQVEQGLVALFSFLGGSCLKDNDLVVLTLPLAESVSISLDLSKKADWEFASDLMSLFHFMQRTVTTKETKETAKLFLYTLSGIQVMDQEYAKNQEASRIFLFAAVKIFSAVESSYDGEFVGVFVFPPSSSINTSGQELSDVKLPIRLSRSLEEVRSLLGSPSPSGGLSEIEKTLIQAEVTLLVRGSLVLATSVILLVATLLGSCYLLGMPLTRDTLLYSSARLD